MSPSNFPAHSNGRRHQLALSKVDANLPLLPTVSHGNGIHGKSWIGSDDTTSTPISSTLLGVHGLVTPLSSLASENILRSTSSTEPVDQTTNQPKRSKREKKPKSTTKSTALLSTYTGFDSVNFTDNRVGFFIDTLPGNLSNNNCNTEYSICDQNCGWCGQCMDHLVNGYVFPTF